MYELKFIKDIYTKKSKAYPVVEKNVKRDESLSLKIKEIKEKGINRITHNSENIKKSLNLPVFPVTVIGSFPQTKDVRNMRKMLREGKISQKEYKNFIQNKIKELIEIEEKAGLDVLVHGEFERSDMVEFFAEKLDGIATTKNGWILSYGTRVYRPPIIYTDVKRPSSMTVEEITFAQSLTKKPVKGILTGPVTILAWSYKTEDIPIDELAYEVALCLADEVTELVRNGIKIVQIDEPAFREHAPIKKRYWDEYFSWAVNAFNIVANAEKNVIIHTHICYSNYCEIIDKLKDMDFDAIFIETARNRGEQLECFKNKQFTKELGPGVWDVHSKELPKKSLMKEIIETALDFIPKEKLWINPDCGLKTRGWEEVTAGLKTLVEFAQELRKTRG